VVHPLLITALLAAQPNASAEDAVMAYGQAVAHNSPEDLARAFQPSAMMYCTDGKAVHGTYQAQWKAKMRASAPPAPPVSTELEWLDSGTTTALARARAVRGTHVFTDYILLARIGGSWRIVGKLCQPAEISSNTSAAAVRAVIDVKLASDRRWDPAMLAQSLDPRALVMSVEDGELVAATLAEWQARYAERRKTSRGNPAAELNRVVDARGNIGTARWSFYGTDGSLWTDRALVMRTAAGWRIMALLFVKEAASHPSSP
jgi:hypothetical protein